LILGGVLNKVARKGTFVASGNQSELGRRRFIYTLMPSNLSLAPEELYSYNYYETIEGMAAEAGRYGLHIIPLYTAKEEKVFARNIKKVLREDACLGFIDPAYAFKDVAVWFNQREIPFVQMGNHQSRDLIWDNHESSAREAVTYLLGKGRKNILFLGVGIHYESEEDKIRGYRAAHAAFGRKIKESLLVFDRKIPEAAGAIALRRLKNGAGIDAIFACNDYAAKSVMDALLNNNIRIPEDIALLGADDMPGAAYCPVPLATLRRPRKKIGVELVKALLRRCRNLAAPKTRKELECEFIYRRSAG
jgi:DNA-binding LacI/PurR family transcriptional regulator